MVYSPFVSNDLSQGARHAHLVNYEGQPIFTLSACGMTARGGTGILPIAIFESKIVYVHATHG